MSTTTIRPCQVSGRHYYTGKQVLDCFLTFTAVSTLTEYVNQEMQDLRFAIPERPTTLPRKGCKADRRVPNGLSSGHSVDKPGYLVSVNSTSSAFDNPYYLDLVAKAANGASAVDVPLESERGVGRHVNRFVTPTAENPEYLGLVDTWTGHS